MAILAECPFCRNKQAAKNKVCKCGGDLDRAKRSKKVSYWISYRIPVGKDEEGKTIYKQRREAIGKSIEKKPSIYKNNSEEDLRNIFQLILETRYDNTTVTGETFNKAGKTDILVKGTNNNNLFIAELKYWGGSKQISKVVNQLESYLTIRDTKSSLVFFVENKDFGNVETQIFNEIKKHKHYKHQNKENLIIDNGNTFTFEKNGKEYLLHVLMFHFQK